MIGQTSPTHVLPTNMRRHRGATQRTPVIGKISWHAVPTNTREQIRDTACQLDWADLAAWRAGRHASQRRHTVYVTHECDRKRRCRSTPALDEGLLHHISRRRYARSTRTRGFYLTRRASPTPARDDELYRGTEPLSLIGAQTRKRKLG